MTPTPFTPDREGVFFGLAAEVYHASPGVSQSTLKAFGEEASPAHYKDSLTRKRKVTDDMMFGTVLHSAVLEPEKFMDSFYTRPSTYIGEGGKAKPWHAGANWCKEWEASKKDKPVVDAELVETIPEILKSVYRHPRFTALLESGQREVSFFKRDEETGLLLKCRCDCVATDDEGKTFIGDLKFTFRGGAERDEFQRGVEQMGYDIQDASYRYVTGASHFIFMVAEREAPFESCEYELGSNDLEGRDRKDYREIGLLKYRALLRRYAECVKNDSWPGYPDTAVIGPSKYYKP